MRVPSRSPMNVDLGRAISTAMEHFFLVAGDLRVYCALSTVNPIPQLVFPLSLSALKRTQMP